ncbi:uncharacterized protein GGS22DRAFT_162188 [Annulohypoxylon maeteangense]|uniref:uncharacterized protein n=1 Tax=Annulohypoxylon maeteangense TaxID=1927788 RepID=UPI0020076C9D|nr:uncharacterized protein GGS22DRAFT_162188 [Annulohypoxylon maeteangense]KAI0885875.1 hypothetical protein GGS22DRAFT_162188 [Annulohypoxylon maeteangense]
MTVGRGSGGRRALRTGVGFLLSRSKVMRLPCFFLWKMAWLLDGAHSWCEGVLFMMNNQTIKLWASWEVILCLGYSELEVIWGSGGYLFLTLTVFG